MEVILFTAVIFVVLMFVLFIGTPIAMGLGFLGIMGIIIFLDSSLIAALATNTYNQSLSITTVMIPMFILMAELLSNSNIATELFDVIRRRLKRVPANLAISSVVASTVFAALCGSAPASAATIGRISIPSMLKNGYVRSFAAGTQAAGGNLGIIIPPSINFIIYGMITETSIVKLFIAGVFPGLMISAMMIVYILVRNKLDPNLIRPPANIGEIIKEQNSKKISLWHDAVTIGPVFILIVIIFTLLYSGIATAAETAAIGAIGAAIIVFLQKKMSSEVVKKTLRNTTSTSCMILFLMFGGMAFTMFLTVMGLPQSMSSLVISSSPNPWITMLIVCIVFLILGCFVDTVSLMLIILPFTSPFIFALGFDPVWFGVIVTIACAIGMITPPVGMNLFVLKGATGIPMGDIIRGSVPYVIIFVIAIIIICIFPGLALYLPNRM